MNTIYILIVAFGIQNDFNGKLSEVSTQEFESKAACEEAESKIKAARQDLKVLWHACRPK